MGEPEPNHVLDLPLGLIFDEQADRARDVWRRMVVRILNQNGLKDVDSQVLISKEDPNELEIYIDLSQRQDVRGKITEAIKDSFWHEDI
ncbi:MAG: hypothetical protein K9L85_00020 [Candidatus Peribacteraceae bacterium]|nr:hypothetical protein [Candidatus Peribacteraceae bacterium]